MPTGVFGGFGVPVDLMLLRKCGVLRMNGLCLSWITHTHTHETFTDPLGIGKLVSPLSLLHQ